MGGHRMESPATAHAFVLQGIVDQIVKPWTLAPRVQMLRSAKMGGSPMASQGVVRAYAWTVSGVTIARRYYPAVLENMGSPAKMGGLLLGTATVHLAVACANRILLATTVKTRRG